MVFGRGARRRFEFSTEVPSVLDGVVFQAVGSLEIDTSGEAQPVEWPAVEAAARSTVEEVATDIAKECSPRRLWAAQQRLSDRLALRTPVTGFPASWLTARCQLGLSSADERRTRIFHDAVRSEQLQIAIERERLNHLGEILGDRRLARIWWLDRHQEQAAAMSWEDFDKQILAPLATTDEPGSGTERTARILAQVFEEIESSPERQAQFLEVTKIVLSRMGWQPLTQQIDGERDEAGRQTEEAG